MNVKELIASLDKLSNELHLADHSIGDLCKNIDHVTIDDLHFLNELAPLESHLDHLLQEGSQLRYDITNTGWLIDGHNHDSGTRCCGLSGFR